MSDVILHVVSFEVNAEQTRQRIEESHANARALITWLSFPGTPERHGITDAPYLITMLKLLISSCTPEDTIEGIEELVAYVKRTVGQVAQS